MGAYKRGKNTCARTWRSKRGGGLFSGEYDNTVICVSAAVARGGSEVMFSTVKLEYMGPNPHSVSILHFFFPQFFL